MNKKIVIIAVVVLIIAFAVAFYVYIQSIQSNLPPVDYSANSTNETQQDIDSLPSDAQLQGDLDELHADVESF